MPLKVYKASAGSGKTFTLAREYILMLLKDEGRMSHRRILGVTFTLKATAEMKERIIDSLFALSTHSESKYRGWLSSALGMSGDQVDRRAGECLNDILQDYSFFSISTIDSFFQRIVRSFAHELGWSGTYNIELDEDAVRERAIDDMLFDISAPEHQDLLQWVTQFMLHRIDNGDKWNPKKAIQAISTQLDNSHVSQILADTDNILHDKKALSEYISTLKSITFGMDNHVKKIRSKVESQLKCFGLTTKNFSKGVFAPLYWSPAEYEYPLKPAMLKAINDPDSSVPKTSKTLSKEERESARAVFVQHIHPLFVAFAELMQEASVRRYQTARVILNHIYTTGLLSDVARQIDLSNHLENRMPISETAALLNRVVRDGAPAPFVYEKIGQRIKHYMIDEFQDTGQIQWSNFVPLLQESMSIGENNLVVGDVKQSIYRWRQSDYHLLQHDIEQTFHLSKDDIINLKVNYRSSRDVVDFNSRCFDDYAAYVQQHFNDRNPQATALSHEVTDAYADVHQVADKELSGHVRLYEVPQDTFKEKAIELMLFHVESALQRGVKACKIAVLASKNSELSVLISALVDKGYKVASNEGLAVGSHPAVAFLLTCIRLLYATNDRLYRYELQHLWEEAMGTTPMPDLPKDLISTPLMQMVEKLICHFSLNTWQYAQSYLTAFSDIVYLFCSTQTAHPLEFLRYWDETGHKKTLAAPRTTDSIQAMTIHKSKGLEFDLVLIPFCNWKICEPTNNNGNIIWCEPKQEPFNRMPLVALDYSKRLLLTQFDQDYAAEELGYAMDFINLTYVAFTRAKRELIVCCKANEKEDKSPSLTPHLLLKCLNDKQEEHRVEGETPFFDFGSDSFRFDDEPSADSAPADNDTIAYGKMVPIGQRLRQRHLLELEELIESAKTGTSALELSHVVRGKVLHDILSLIKTEQDLEPALEQQVREGGISESDMASLRVELEQLFSLSKPYHWFDGGWEQLLLEHDLILADGTTLRPDRLMIRDGVAHIIDYKFGDHKSAAYHRQVGSYMEQLTEMGYAVRGFLVYVQLKEVEEVLA